MARPEVVSRLAIPPLGVSLATLGALAWLTGLGYLAIRVGLPSLVAPAVLDGLHIYVGLASVVVLGTKVWRVGFRHDVVGVQRPATWHRWMSWTMLGLYVAVYATGILALLPAGQGTRTQLVDAHLIASVWAAVPTTWHVWHYRHLAAPYLRPFRQRPGRRVWLGLAVTLIPVAVAGAIPRSAGQLSALGAGGAWQTQGPQVFLDRMEVTPDGRTAVAAGAGLYAGDLATGRWRRISAYPLGDTVLGLALPRGGPVAVYVGATAGLDAAPSLDGPYRRLPLPAHEVHGIAVDPADPLTVWASSRSGVWRSGDAGAHWQQENAGIPDPVSTWALAYRDGNVFASDVDGVYGWDGTRWRLSIAFPYVASLTLGPDGRLFASSMGEGVRIFDGHSWQDGNEGLATHAHGGVSGIHVVTVTALPNGTAYAGTMLDGAAASRDGGRTWAAIWPGLTARGDVWRIVRTGNHLVAATDRGISTYLLPVADPPGWAWWSVLTFTTVAAAVLGVALAAWRRRTPPGVALLGHTARRDAVLTPRGGT